MGFWSGIKYALNSTLGTNGFQSLDKMILGAKGLVESDNLYLNTEINESFKITLNSYQNTTLKTANTIRANWAGSIKIEFKANTNQISNGRTTVIATKNGTQIYSASATFDTTTHSLIIPVTQGDEIKLGFYLSLGNVASAQNFYVSIYDVKIFADLIDVSGVSIL